jgi:hypothetical protein
MKYKQSDAAHGYEQSVDAHPEDYRWSEWLVYPDYDVGEHEGRRYVYAPMVNPEKQIFERWRYRPLSRPTAALFLEFARWPEEEGMDRRPLGTKRNEEAALEWARVHGVLGLSSARPFTVLGQASEAIRQALGTRGGIRPRSRNEGYGGREETVEAFAREAWIANMTLHLYEAATNPEGPDLDAIVVYMSGREDLLGDYLPSMRELHGKSPEYACRWALSVVEEIVEDRMRGRVWPLPVGDHNERGDFVGHKQGWAFDSLLGAMWLQMMWLMLGQSRRCESCGRLLDVHTEQELDGGAGVSSDGKRKARSDRRFCDARCRAKWNYHHGNGRSSKNARKQQRTRLARKS